MASISLTPNSMAPSPISKSYLLEHLSTSASEAQFWEAMQADETTYSDTEDYETEYACKLVREQASTEETMVVKVMIRKPGNAQPNGTSTTLLEITGTKSMTKELVVNRQSFTVPKDQIGERTSKSTNMGFAPAHAQDSRVPTKSMSLKEAIASMRDNLETPARPQIATARPPLQPKVVQQRNTSPRPNHRPPASAREQFSRHPESLKPDLDSPAFQKHPRLVNSDWPIPGRTPSRDDEFKPTGILKKRSISPPQFMIGSSIPSWEFLLRRPMYLETMTVKPISQLNMSPKCSDVVSGILNKSPLERYLATRLVKRHSSHFVGTLDTVTRTSSPSILVATLTSHHLIHVPTRALSMNTRRFMTGRLSVGNMVVQSQIDRSPATTQSLSRFKMPAVLKVQEQIYPFKLVPSVAEERPLETSYFTFYITNSGSGYLDRHYRRSTNPQRHHVPLPFR